MFQRRPRRDAMEGIDDQQFPYEILGVVGDSGPILLEEFVFPHAYLAEEGALIFLHEGGVSDEEDVDYDPHGPQVHGLIVGMILEDLGGDVRGGAAPRDEGVGGVHPLGESEVSHLDVGVILPADQEEILRLEVPMGDAAIVHVGHRVQQHLGQIPGVQFSVVILLHDPIEDVPPVEQFHHHVEEVLLLVKIVEGHDVSMLEGLEYGDLVEELGVVLGFEILAAYDLDGDHPAGFAVFALPDRGEGSGADLLGELV
mmetsp:Transcript_54213/g.162327  ORF Transcript_54213/g.162327 Transcript_54213/m.162327 type:complete len:256 (+) Transcript_54213:697-1464(+)